MKHVYSALSIFTILLLSGCGGGQQQVQEVPEDSDEYVTMAAKEGETTKISFFDDQDLGDFDALEQLVLDDQFNDKPDTFKLVDNEQAIDFQEVADNDNTQVVYFDYDSSKPRQDQEESLTSLKQRVRDWTKQGKTVVFKGHSCLWHGTRAYNLALSGQRAQWLADACGVQNKNIKVFGVGNEEPLVQDTHSKMVQSPNRRVEVYTL